MDAKQLEEAIAAMKRWMGPPHLGEETRLLVEAAEAHLATLPDPKDHIVVGVRRGTGEAFIFNAMSSHLMTAEKAKERAEMWGKDYPHVTYVTVKLPA